MKRSLLVATLLAWPLGVLAVDPGNWELQVTGQVGPQSQPVAATQTYCLNESDTRDPSKLLGGTTGTCEFSNKNDDGSTYSFDVQCTGSLPMKGHGSVHYTRDTLDGDLDLTDSSGGFALRSAVKGKRLGPC